MQEVTYNAPEMSVLACASALVSVKSASVIFLNEKGTKYMDKPAKKAVDVVSVCFLLLNSLLRVLKLFLLDADPPGKPQNTTDKKAN